MDLATDRKYFVFIQGSDLSIFLLLRVNGSISYDN